MKLKKKQLPLLYSDTCTPYLDKLDLKAENISQQVYFKAQLFVPFRNQNIQLKTLNTDCISGFYIKQTELHKFKACKFYIPIKKDWLLLPHTKVNWLNIDAFKLATKEYVEQNFSALFWVKFKSGELKKAFLVCW